MGVFLANAPLYPKQGYWLSYTFWIAAMVALGFLVVGTVLLVLAIMQE